jgi:predicted dehydrogenase
MTEETKIKVGVIGVGYLGRFHALRWKEVPSATLVGVADISLGRAAQVASEVGCQAFAKNEELLRQVQAVSIVVPTVDHYAVAKQALLMDKDILLEKPVTMTLEEADELVALANQRNRIFMVGHLERFNPAVRALAELLTRPAFIEAHRLGAFQERASNIDVVRDLMIHDLDIILSLLKSRLQRVSAMGIAVLSDKIDIANARLEFENGSVANLTASRVNIGESVRKIRIFQTENYISLDYQKKEMAIFTLGPGKDQDPMSRIKISHVPIGDEDALHAELTAFAEAVATRVPPPVTGEEGRRALEAALIVNREIASSLKKFFQSAK